MALRNFIWFILPAASLAITTLHYYESPSCLADSEIGDFSCHFSPWDVQPCQHTPLNTLGLIADEIENGCTIMTYCDRSCALELGPISKPNICFSSTSAGSHPIIIVNSDKSNTVVDHDQQQQRKIGSWQVICSGSANGNPATPSSKNLLERKNKRQENDDDYMYTEAVAVASTSPADALTNTEEVPTTSSPSSALSVTTSGASSVLPDTAMTTSTSTWLCSDCDATAATVTEGTDITTDGSSETWTTWLTTTTVPTNGNRTNATVSMGRPSTATSTRAGNGLTSTGGAAAVAAPGGDFAAGKGGKVEMLAAVVVLGAALMM